MTNDRNLFLAIALSVVVLIGWNYFFGIPEAQRQQRAAQTQAVPGQVAPGLVPGPEAGRTGTGAPGTPSPTQVTPAPGAPTAIAPEGALTREAALALSPRVTLASPKLDGSINLRGGRIDDVRLRTYHETVDPRSPEIVLLSPSRSPAPFFAEVGTVAAAAGTAVPGPDTVWTADADRLVPERPLTLTYDNGAGLLFTRRIAVDGGTMFTVTDRVENRGAAPVTLHPYALVSRRGTPVTQGVYVLHEGLVGVLGEEGLQEYTYAAIEKDPTKTWRATSGFVGITDKYWAAAVIPEQGAPYAGKFAFRNDGAKSYQTDVLLDPRTAAPGGSFETTTRVFAGAKEVGAVEAYASALGVKRFEFLIDWGWFYFITKPLFHVLEWFKTLTGNFGVAILIVTLLVKALFFPLANKSYASMAKMKILQPKMLELKEKYPDDKMKQQQELMELYKREKINPVAGCWPMLVQIPVFFALYKVLFVTIEMRHAPFFGWIRDLAAPDPSNVFNLFGLIPITMPQMLHVGLWPILMGITQFVQMKMNPEPTDPSQKLIFTWMPLFFTWLLASFPAGLVIYWTWNNLLSVLQQYAILRRSGVKVELWDNLRGMVAKKDPKPAAP